MKVPRVKNLKAFILIEIVAVIAIIGLFLLISLPIINDAINVSKLKYFENQENMILISGRDYFTDDRNRLPKEVGMKEIVSLGNLIGNGYIEKITDNKGNECDNNNTVVEVTNVSDGSYLYNVRLVCSEYDSKIAWSEWSDWSTVAPSGQNIDVEESQFYNYQDIMEYYGEWSDWQDVITKEDRLTPVLNIVGTDTQERTVYQYQDQEWIWYNEVEESQCSATTPAGEGWVQGTVCETSPETQCSATSPGAEWTQGSICDTEPSSCRSTSPGAGWTQGSACRWNKSTTYATKWNKSTTYATKWNKTTSSTTCATDGTGSACDWTTETSSCVSSSPGTGWTASTACTRQHSMTSACQSSAPNQWWTAGTICTRRYDRTYCVSNGSYCCANCTDGGWGSCSSTQRYCNERSSCVSSSPGTGWTASSVCTRRWNWSGCDSAGSGTICTRRYTRQVATKWNKTTTSTTCATDGTGSACDWSSSTSCATDGTGSACDWSTTNSCATDGTGSACQWVYTRPHYTYTRQVDSKWTYARTVQDPTVDYYSEQPDGYTYKDESQSRLTEWSAWSDIAPTLQPYRTVNSKQQFRTRDIINDWTGNVLDKYVTEDELTTLLGMTLAEIEADPNKRVVSITQYRYRTRVY